MTGTPRKHAEMDTYTIVPRFLSVTRMRHVPASAQIAASETGEAVITVLLIYTVKLFDV